MSCSSSIQRKAWQVLGVVVVFVLTFIALGGAPAQPLKSAGIIPTCPVPVCGPERSPSPSPPPPSFFVAVRINPVGSGVTYHIDDAGEVTSIPSGLNCKRNCQARFRLGTVALYARQISSNWVFDSWGGACSGSSTPFVITVTPDHLVDQVSCTATYKLKPGVSFKQNILDTNYPNPSYDTSSATWPNSVCGNKDWPQFPPYLGPPTEWVPINVPVDVGISGTALSQNISGGDLWFTHPFGFDWEFYIAPDQQYYSLLGLNNIMGGPKVDDQYKAALKQAKDFGLQRPDQVLGVLGVETDQGLVPPLYRASDGDRVAVLGRWIVDCGHDDFHTEIHPPLLLATSNAVDGGESTYSTIIGRPYLVSQTFTTDGEPFPTHMLNEVVKATGLTDPAGILESIGVTDTCPWYWPALVPCSLQLEAHPQFFPKPFSGAIEMSYLVRPPTSRVDPRDQLIVQFHFTERSGVTIFVVPSPSQSDTVQVTILMDARYYQQAPLPRNPGCNISVDELRASGDNKLFYVETGEWLAANAFPLFAAGAAIISQGIDTDCYDAPDPHSATENMITTLPITQLVTNGVALPVGSLDDGQPFPISGWLKLSWQRYSCPFSACHPPPPPQALAGAHWQQGYSQLIWRKRESFWRAD